MFSIFRRRVRKAETRQEAIARGWNECLEAALKMVAEHKWVVDDDDPTEVFCDGCGETLVHALEGMRR